jgi:hypothetical protein
MIGSTALVVLGVGVIVCLGLVGLIFMIMKADVDYEEKLENEEHRKSREKN